MEIKDNFSLFNLFLDKKVEIFVGQESFQLVVPTIRDFHLNSAVNIAYHLWTSSLDKLQSLLPSIAIESSFDFLKKILFTLGGFKEFRKNADLFRKALKFLLPQIELNFQSKQLIVDNIIITDEVWEYILYVLKLTCGEKVEKPRTFSSEEERKFYLAQKKMEEKIKSIRSQKSGDSESLLKAFLTIQYSFDISFDYLANQTLVQIQWLQTYAAGAMSYEVNAQAFAAGNMKKGKKLDFFIK